MKGEGLIVVPEVSAALWHSFRPSVGGLVLEVLMGGIYCGVLKCLQLSSMPSDPVLGDCCGEYYLEGFILVS